MSDTEDDLVRAHLHLARAAARFFARAHPTERHDDVYADALLGLLRAVRTYRPEKGAKLASWAKLRMAGTMLDGMRERQRCRRDKPRRPWHSAVSLEAWLDGLGLPMRNSIEDDAPPVDAAAEARDGVARLMAGLSRREQALLLARFVEGRTFAEIGPALGLSESGAQRAFAELLAELRGRAASCPHLRECCV